MAHDLDFFLALETRVWQALVSGDADSDAALLSKDFLGVYATGFAGRDDHSGQLKAGPSVAHFALFAPCLVDLGADQALLAYRAEYVRAGSDVTEAMYVSSIWRREGSVWRNIFSQDSAESVVAPV